MFDPGVHLVQDLAQRATLPFEVSVVPVGILEKAAAA